jgi:hypothetical protein
MVLSSEDKILPIKPILFEKAKLSSKEFANYLYELDFKKKKVRDMSLAGYIHAIHPYLRDVQSEVIHYGYVGDRKIMSAVIKCTITVSYKTSAMSGILNDMKFTALADGDTTNVPSSDTLVRTVETRALKRAIARALDISKVDLNDEFVDEEEIGTPMNGDSNDDTPSTHKRKTPQDIAAEKRRKQEELERQAEQEDNDENAARKEDAW